jgi:hypothetical protein
VAGQRRGDNGCKPSPQGCGELKPQQCAAVAHARAEQLGKIGRLQPEHPQEIGSRLLGGDVWFVVEDDIQQGAVDFDMAVVVNQA